VTTTLDLMADFAERYGPLQDRGWTQRHDGLLLPPGAEPDRPADRPVGVDLFAGAGGFSLGFEQAGFHVASAAEGDYDAMCTYLTNLGTDDSLIHFLPAFEGASKKAKKLCDARVGEAVTAGELGCRMPGVGYIRNHPDEVVGCEHFYFGDITALTGAQVCDDLGVSIGDVDCVFGGPPCQGFSIGGRRNVVDPRNSLVFEFARLVCEIKPRALCMENVPGIVSMTTPEGIPVLDALASILEKGGMGTYTALRNVLADRDDVKGAVRGQGNTRKPKRNNDPDDDELLVEEDPQLALEVLA